jgi:hypothetical protein
MSHSVEPLRETNPEAAEFIENWQKFFERDYDLSEIDEKSSFVEALQTLANFVADENKNATINLSLSSDGVISFVTQTSPKTKEV